MLGVQAFTQAFASGIVPWHVIALVMTSPFFVMFGAAVLLVSLTPVNLLFSVHAGFEIPTGNILWLLILGSAIMYFAQHFLTLSYASADAAYVQPLTI